MFLNTIKGAQCVEVLIPSDAGVSFHVMLLGSHSGVSCRPPGLVVRKLLHPENPLKVGDTTLL